MVVVVVGHVKRTRRTGKKRWMRCCRRAFLGGGSVQQGERTMVEVVALRHPSMKLLLLAFLSSSSVSRRSPL
jgi:hypothetical protein